MTGPRTATPNPTDLTLHTRSRLLEVAFDDGQRFSLPWEYLRVFSPSAEVRGHGADEMVLVPGKRDVRLLRIEPVGLYAVKLVFDDGHDSGLYSWDVLYDLGSCQAEYWQQYLDRLAAAGLNRDQTHPSAPALRSCHS